MSTDYVLTHEKVGVRLSFTLRANRLLLSGLQVDKMNIHLVDPYCYANLIKALALTIRPYTLTIYQWQTFSL